MAGVKWGIISTGSIARNFAVTVAEMNKSGENIEILGVASRSIEGAKRFAEEHGIERAYGSYEDMAADPDIDAVYIATPHNFHYENMLLCLNNGKHILCEKTFTITAREAREIFALAEEKGLFVMEAFWTKLIPLYREIERQLAEGVIGETRVLTAQYGYRTARPERKFEPELAGGALMDIGVYAVGFAAMLLGYEPVQVLSSVKMNEAGTDEIGAIILEYPGGKMAQLTSALQTFMPITGCIYGSKGYISIKEFRNPTSAEIVLNDGSSFLIEAGFDINGYEYEIREAEHCITRGKHQSEIITPEHTIGVMEILDKIRELWGMKFPFEG